MINLIEPYKQYEGKWIDSELRAIFLVKYLEHSKTSDKINHIRYLCIEIHRTQKKNFLIRYWFDEREGVFNFKQPSNQESHAAIKVIFDDT